MVASFGAVAEALDKTVLVLNKYQIPFQEFSKHKLIFFTKRGFSQETAFLFADKALNPNPLDFLPLWSILFGNDICIKPRFRPTMLNQIRFLYS